MPKTLNYLFFFSRSRLILYQIIIEIQRRIICFITNMVFVCQILNPPLGLHTLLRLQSELLWWKSHVGVPLSSRITIKHRPHQWGFVEDLVKDIDEKYTSVARIFNLDCRSACIIIYVLHFRINWWYIKHLLNCF